MSIHHHPSDASLVSYAAGALPEGAALVIATHLALCAPCRRGVETAEAMGGGLLDATAPDPMSDGAHAVALRQLVEPVPAVPPRREYDPLVPSPLAEYLGGTLADLPWRRLPGGVRFVDVLPRSRRGGNVRLLRVAPGCYLPRHGHRGGELTLVLSGSFLDEIGRFARGDVAELDSEVNHQPVVDPGDDCICLIATDAPVRFDTLVGRLAQRFIGW